MIIKTKRKKIVEISSVSIYILYIIGLFYISKDRFDWIFDIFNMILVTSLLYISLESKVQESKRIRWPVFCLGIWVLFAFIFGFVEVFSIKLHISKYLLSDIQYIFVTIGSLIFVVLLLLISTFLFDVWSKSVGESINKKKIFKYTFFLFSIWIFFSWLFGIIYTLFGVLKYSPQSCIFDINGIPIDPTDINNWYFSIVTMTTSGYGDLHPEGSCRLIASIEAFFGYFLLAVSVGLAVFIIETISKKIKQ